MPEYVMPIDASPDSSMDLENDTCVCGRYAWKLHCPHCGSSECYAFSPRKRHDTVTRSDNTIVHLTVYRCRKCAATFNDDDWRLRCTAPHQRLGRRPGAPTVRQREMTSPKSFGDLSEMPDALQDALAILKKRRGIE